ncbi:MAG: response regulator [Chloroflexota bacterium]
MAAIRVIIADEFSDVRRQLVTRLHREPDFIIVGEARDNTQALKCTLNKRPDLLLIDPMMSDGLGMYTLQQITQQVPETAVVVLTTVADTALRMELEKVGVKRVLTKCLDSDDMIAVLRQVAQNSRLLDNA